MSSIRLSTVAEIREYVTEVEKNIEDDRLVSIAEAICSFSEKDGDVRVSDLKNLAEKVNTKLVGATFVSPRGYTGIRLLWKKFCVSFSNFFGGRKIVTDWEKSALDQKIQSLSRKIPASPPSRPQGVYREQKIAELRSFVSSANPRAIFDQKCREFRQKFQGYEECIPELQNFETLLQSWAPDPISLSVKGDAIQIEGEDAIVSFTEGKYLVKKGEKSYSGTTISGLYDTMKASKLMTDADRVVLAFERIDNAFTHIQQTVESCGQKAPLPKVWEKISEKDKECAQRGRCFVAKLMEYNGGGKEGYTVPFSVEVYHPDPFSVEVYHPDDEESKSIPVFCHKQTGELFIQNGSQLEKVPQSSKKLLQVGFRPELFQKIADVLGIDFGRRFFTVSQLQQAIASAEELQERIQEKEKEISRFVEQQGGDYASFEAQVEQIGQEAFPALYVKPTREKSGISSFLRAPPVVPHSWDVVVHKSAEEKEIYRLVFEDQKFFLKTTKGEMKELFFSSIIDRDFFAIIGDVRNPKYNKEILALHTRKTEEKEALMAHPAFLADGKAQKEFDSIKKTFGDGKDFWCLSEKKGKPQFVSCTSSGHIEAQEVEIAQTGGVLQIRSKGDSDFESVDQFVSRHTSFPSIVERMEQKRWRDAENQYLQANQVESTEEELQLCTKILKKSVSGIFQRRNKSYQYVTEQSGVVKAIDIEFLDDQKKIRIDGREYNTLRECLIAGTLSPKALKEEYLRKKADFDAKWTTTLEASSTVQTQISEMSSLAKRLQKPVFRVFKGDLEGSKTTYRFTTIFPGGTEKNRTITIDPRNLSIVSIQQASHTARPDTAEEWIDEYKREEFSLGVDEAQRHNQTIDTAIQTLRDQIEFKTGRVAGWVGKAETYLLGGKEHPPLYNFFMLDVQESMKAEAQSLANELKIPVHIVYKDRMNSSKYRSLLYLPDRKTPEEVSFSIVEKPQTMTAVFQTESGQEGSLEDLFGLYATSRESLQGARERKRKAGK